MSISVTLEDRAMSLASCIAVRDKDWTSGPFIREAVIVSLVERPGKLRDFLQACQDRDCASCEAFFQLYEVSIIGFSSFDRSLAQVIESFETDLTWDIVSKIPSLLDLESYHPIDPPVAYEINGAGTVYDAAAAFGPNTIVLLNDPFLDLEGYTQLIGMDLIDELVKAGLRKAAQEFPRTPAP